MLTQVEYDGLKKVMELREASVTPLEFGRVKSRVDEAYAKATGDLGTWLKNDFPRAQRRFQGPVVTFLLRQSPRAQAELTKEDLDELTTFVVNPTAALYAVRGMSEEKKAEWHARIQRWLKVLPIIAGLTPPPYNLAVIGVIVLLMIIDKKFFTPAELAVALETGVLPLAALKEQTKMSTFWSQLLNLLLSYLTQAFGSQFGDFFKKIFGDAAQGMPEPDIKVGDAPDEVKNKIKKLLTDLVNKALDGKPILRRVCLGLIGSLPDAFLDGVWDMIFKDEIATGKLGSAASLNLSAGPLKAMAPVSGDELKACKAEAGI